MDYPEKRVEIREKKTAQRPFLKARDTPPIGIALLYGLQQVMVCVSALLTVPLIMADSMCPGSSIGEILNNFWNQFSVSKSFLFQRFYDRHSSVRHL